MSRSCSSDSSTQLNPSLAYVQIYTKHYVMALTTVDVVCYSRTNFAESRRLRIDSGI